jgi:hypothetical protein
LIATEHETDPKDTSILAKEERGEMLFTVRTVELLLK